MNIVYWLLATTALIVSTFAQTPNGTRKAWNDTLWIDRDGTYQLVGDYINTQNQSTLQFKDTNALNAASFDSAGFVVNLKQLSSSNKRGGGLFVLRPAAEYVVDGATVFASGNAAYEWVRMEVYAKRGFFDPQWWGAAPSATASTNVTALQAAITKAVASDNDTAEVVFSGSGTYKFNGKITIPNSGSNHNGITIRSTPGPILDLTAADTLFEIVGFVSRITFYGLQMRGHAGAGLAIYHGPATTGSDYVIEYCKFDSFATGIHLEDVTNVRLQNNYFDRGGKGVRAGYNSDAWYVSNNVFFLLDTCVIVDGSSSDNFTLSNNTLGYSDVGYVHTGGGGFNMSNNYWEGVVELGKVGTGASGNRNVVIIGDTYQSQSLTTTGWTFLDFDVITVTGIKQTGNFGGVLFDIQNASAAFTIQNSVGGDSVKFKNDNDYRYMFNARRISYNTRDTEIRNANLGTTKINNPVWENRFFSSTNHTIYNYRKTGATNNATTWHQGLKDVSGASGLLFIQPGSIVVGDTTIAAGAGIELTSTTKGILTSRMATASRNAISAAFSSADSTDNQGLLLFDTITDSLYYWTGTGWRNF